MKHSKYQERYRKIRRLIIEENTGCPDEFAEKIGLSRRMLYDYMGDLRDEGMDIEYSRKRKTFYLLGKCLVLQDAK